MLRFLTRGALSKLSKPNTKSLRSRVSRPRLSRTQWRSMTEDEKLSVASGPGAELTPPDPGDWGLIPPHLELTQDEEMEVFEEGKVTVRTWVDSETKKLDAGRPEVQLYQASREAQIMKLWYNDRFQEAIDLATAELKALRVEKASARGYQEQKFFELLSIPYLMCRANDQLRLGQYELALKDIDAIMAIEPNIPAPQHYVLRSSALSALGRIDEAWEASVKALEYGPEEQDVLEHASIILEARSDWQKLIEITDKLSEIYEINIQRMSPDELADLAIRRATAFEGLGNWEECKNAADNSINNRPTDISGYLLKGKAETKLGEHNEALRTYNEVLRRWSSHPGAYNLRAEVLIQLERGLDAVAAAQHAIQAAQNLYNPTGTRAELEGSLEAVGMEQLSGTPEAELRAQVAEMQKNFIAEGYKLLAMSHMHQKNLKQALEAVNESLKVDGASVEVKELKMKIQDAIIANT